MTYGLAGTIEVECIVASHDDVGLVNKWLSFNWDAEILSIRVFSKTTHTEFYIIYKKGS